MNNMKVSSRYAIPVSFLLVLALIPTILHNYLETKVVDGRSINLIPTSLNNFTSLPTKRTQQWCKDIFDTEDCFERIYQKNSISSVKLFVARSYDHKHLYHHPELALSYGQSLPNKKIIHLPGHPDLPIHVLSEDNQSLIVTYLLMYEDGFIKDPINHQLKDSLKSLVTPRKQITLFYVSQTQTNNKTAIENSMAVSVLMSAVQSFQSQTN